MYCSASLRPKNAPWPKLSACPTPNWCCSASTSGGSACFGTRACLCACPAAAGGLRRADSGRREGFSGFPCAVENGSGFENSCRGAPGACSGTDAALAGSSVEFPGAGLRGKGARAGERVCTGYKTGLRPARALWRRWLLASAACASSCRNVLVFSGSEPASTCAQDAGAVKSLASLPDG